MKILLTLTALLTITFFTVSAQSEFRTSSSTQGLSSLISIGWYPNPVSVGEKIKVNIQLEEQQELKTELLDALGKKIFEVQSTYPPGKSYVQIHTNDLKQGLYFVRVSTDTGSQTEKIIIK